MASLPVSWLGLYRLGVTACRVSSRGGRAFPGARGFFLQGRGGQETSSACLRGGDGHQPQADRLGLPGAGGGVGHGEQLGEGQQVTGQGHDQAPDTVLGEPLQGKAVKPGVLGAADTVLAAGS